MTKIDFKRTLFRSMGNIFRPVYRVNDIQLIFYGPKTAVKVGKGSYGRIHVYSYQTNCNISIGNYNSISEITMIMGGNHHRGITTFPFKALRLGMDVSEDNLRSNGIEIGNDCWIGQGVVILDGVKISTGSIIGANSVIAKSTNPYSINVGNPSVEIGKRFGDEDIHMLLESHWWNIEEEILIGNIDLLYSNRVSLFVKRIKESR